MKSVGLAIVFQSFERLLEALRKRDLPVDMVRYINAGIDEVNRFHGTEREMKRLVRRTQKQTLRKLEKELKLVVKNHYRDLWMALGLSVFGVPLGLAFAVSSSNMSFLAIGIPMGMVLGMAVGAGLDKQAKERGLQIEVEVKH